MSLTTRLGRQYFQLEAFPERRVLGTAASPRSRTIGVDEGGLMGKVISSMGVSLDGFIAGPNGEIDWSAPDEELHRFHNEQTGKTARPRRPAALTKNK
jgi:hypothetical protein